ncbi:glycosyl hydrolase catalytic core-domain-containing protein [Mycena olivaceomarginata]|nr:glycosyl hydrolase catalytic core-domain-containing protein [Mycena olivaceomarginata]
MSLSRVRPGDSTEHPLLLDAKGHLVEVQQGPPPRRSRRGIDDGPVSPTPIRNQRSALEWMGRHQLSPEFLLSSPEVEKWDDWNQRKSEMETTIPEHLLGFNKPDVSTQANMTPSEAVDLWMQEIEPWAANGTKLGSPAIAWDLKLDPELLN